MFKKIKHKTSQLAQQWHDQFAEFKSKVKANLAKTFPVVNREISDKYLDAQALSDIAQQTFSTQKIITFWAVGLLFVAIGFLLYRTLSYVYMMLAAFILSLALEGMIRFWTRLTRSRGVGIGITYLLFLLFLISGFIIITPFFVSRGTQFLQSMMIHIQAIQADIVTQGIDAYIKGLKRIPDFLNEEILHYIKKTNSASLLQSLIENLANIVNFSSSYLKTLGNSLVTIFGSIFSGAGKVIILFTLSVFFSISHFEVKYGIKYLSRNLSRSKEKIDEVYHGIAAWLRSQLILCVFIGLTSYVGLRILDWFGFDLPQKWVLALLAGLFEIIPYLWPFLWGLPAVAFAILLYGFPWFFVVVITYTVIQQIEEKFFVPVLMSKTLGVNPLLVFVCMLFGGIMMGIFGIILAVPIAVIFSIVLKLPEEDRKLP